MQRLDARTCDIVSLDNNTAKLFLEDNHRQGYAKFLFSYGLIFNGELVQALAVGRPRFNRSYQYEIIRDCSKKNTIVRGGISKLWKHFIENNNVASCICYSYPHNDQLYTNKYVEYCGFINTKRSKPEKRVYYEGSWNDKYKRIDKSLLERYGVDALLGTNEGHDRTNEQILLSLGFIKRCENGISPQVDSYMPFGIVYRVDDITDGSFYIGQTENQKRWDNGYLGSGHKWKKHLSEHPDHYYKRTIILKAKTPTEMFRRESYEIKANIDNELCLNTYSGVHRANPPMCPECGGVYNHKKWCSHANLCSECGGITSHYKTCSKYNRKQTSIICPECGAIGGTHKNGCSKAITCEECSSVGGHHKKTCSKYVAPRESDIVCEECGCKRGKHYSTCSKYKSVICSECGARGGSHLKSCSKYKPKAVSVCEECGGKSGNHKKVCSKYVERIKICQECGGKNNHKKCCSKYKDKSICSECGSKNGKHKRTCSKYKPSPGCPECGVRSGNHLKTCSRYKARRKPDPCPECGGFWHHYKTCSKYSRSSKYKRRGNDES